MTEALVRLADTITPATPIALGARLLLGTVMQTGPPIRVDVGAMQLSCDTLIGVLAGAAVYVLQQGETNLIIGPASSQLVQRFAPSSSTFGLTNGSAFGTFTFPAAFPTACDGINLTNFGVGFMPSDAIVTVNSISASTVTFFMIHSNTLGGYASANWAFYASAWGH